MFPKRLLAFILLFALVLMGAEEARAQWVPIQSPPNSNINSLAAIGDTLLAGTENNGVFRSYDHGLHWLPSNTGLNDTNTIALAVLGRDVFVSTWSYSFTRSLFRSTDGGRTWDSTNLTSTYISMLSAIGNTLFACGGNSLYRSMDSGITWAIVDSGIPQTTIRAMTSMGTVLFVATDAGVFQSYDNGTSWNISGLLAVSTALISHGPHLFAATEYDGVYVSTDSGASWSRANNRLPEDTSVTAFASIGNAIFAGTGGTGIFLWNDTGIINTKLLWNRMDFPSSNISAFLAADSLFYTASSDGIFLSTNLGTDWSARNMGMPNSQIEVIGIGDTNWYVETGGGPFVTSVNKENWRMPITFPSFTSFVAVPFGVIEDIIVVEAENAASGFISRTTDNGMSWTGTSVGCPITSLAVVGNGLIIAGSDSSGIFLSTDNGYSWNGSSFFTLDTENALSNEPITSLAVVSGLSTLFAGIDGLGILRTRDSGASWDTLNVGLTDLHVRALCSIGTTLFAGTSSRGVFLSTDLGEHWNPINAGLDDSEVLSLVATDSDLLAGTYGMGIWERPLSDFGISSVAQTQAPAGSEIQVYPNPSSGSTTVSFTSAVSGYAEVSIVNMLGEEVARLYSGELAAGEHSFIWGADETSAQQQARTPAPRDGMYECLVRMNGEVKSAGIVVMR